MLMRMGIPYDSPKGRAICAAITAIMTGDSYAASAEMADKGGSGIELDLDKVPQREANMSAYDMMLSESQERMLAVLKPGREAEARAARTSRRNTTVSPGRTGFGQRILSMPGEPRLAACRR